MKCNFNYIAEEFSQRGVGGNQPPNEFRIIKGEKKNKITYHLIENDKNFHHNTPIPWANKILTKI